MTLLILGLVLWTVVHLLKRVAPDARARMDARMGAGPARGVIAGLLLLSVVLMIVGFRRAPPVRSTDARLGIAPRTAARGYAVTAAGRERRARRSRTRSRAKTRRYGEAITWRHTP